MMWGYPPGWGAFLVMLASMAVLWGLVIVSIMVVLGLGDRTRSTAVGRRSTDGDDGRGADR